MVIFDTTLSKVLKSVRLDTSVLREALSVAQLGPEIEVPALAAMAVAVPTGQEMWRRFKNPEGDKGELNTLPESVTSIFEALADARNRAATVALDDALAELMDET